MNTHAPNLNMNSRRYSIQSLKELILVELAEGFEISLGAMASVWVSVIEACNAANCRRVMIEGLAPTRRMDQDQARALGDLVGKLEGGGLRVAFCLYGYQPDAVTWTFTNTASAGNCSIQFFSDADRGMCWLGS